MFINRLINRLVGFNKSRVFLVLIVAVMNGICFSMQKSTGTLTKTSGEKSGQTSSDSIKSWIKVESTSGTSLDSYDSYDKCNCCDASDRSDKRSAQRSASGSLCIIESDDDISALIDAAYVADLENRFEQDMFKPGNRNNKTIENKRDNKRNNKSLLVQDSSKDIPQDIKKDIQDIQDREEDILIDTESEFRGPISDITIRWPILACIFSRSNVSMNSMHSANSVAIGSVDELEKIDGLSVLQRESLREEGLLEGIPSNIETFEDPRTITGMLSQLGRQFGVRYRGNSPRDQVGNSERQEPLLGSALRSNSPLDLSEDIKLPWYTKLLYGPLCCCIRSCSQQ